ncbi:hypothetical protein [Deinococcus arcticus]|uniref:Uncharacterized protein n=1 Tax=Deinococcus arcticus TaxID=2136176 RepID=A0A2T3W389_9DEIO|nr:hypothetical protein [Deinococcus arcticus]PTA66371.1 hypothetical protein C8263_18200 [Deinococcus arcticus]
MTSAAYQMNWSIEHLLTSDDRTDLTLERVKQHEGLPRFWPLETYVPEGLPAPIIFAANFGYVTYTHFPSNDPQWPIMSRKMLDTLLAVREFPHRAIPVAITDPIVYRADPDPSPDFLEQRLKSANHDYVIVQLTQHLDILNEEASGVERDPDMPWWVGIDQYVLDIPASGLPPIFRLSIQPAQLFILAEARQALAAAGLAGPVYLPLNGYTNGGGEEVDVPVPVPEVPEGA